MNSQSFVPNSELKAKILSMADEMQTNKYSLLKDYESTVAESSLIVQKEFKKPQNKAS